MILALGVRLIVLLAAVSLDRSGLGLLLIVAFSIGLATVLTLVSLALLYVRRFLQWLAERKGFRGASPQGGWITTGGSATLLHLAPLGGAVALIAVGAMLMTRALAAPGLALS